MKVLYLLSTSETQTNSGIIEKESCNQNPRLLESQQNNITTIKVEHDFRLTPEAPTINLKLRAILGQSDADDDDVWFQCGVCSVQFKNQNKFLIHKLSHETRRTPNIFHTSKGETVSIDKISGMDAFIPRIQLRTLEDQLLESVRIIPGTPTVPAEHPTLNDNSHNINGRLRKRTKNTSYNETGSCESDAEVYSDFYSDKATSNSTESEDETIFSSDNQCSIPKKRIRNDCSRSESIVKEPRPKKKKKKKRAKESLFNCRMCLPKEGKFTSNDELKNHFVKHHFKNSVFNCNLCSFENESVQLFLEHMQSHLNMRTCYACNPHTFWNNGYLKHLTDKHVVNGKVQCSLCPYRGLPRNFTAHVRLHAERNFDRPTSSKKIKNPIFSKHEDNGGVACMQYICCYCQLSSKSSEIFVDKHSYSSHMQTHKDEKDNLYHCSECFHVKLKTVSRITQHMKERHSFKPITRPSGFTKPKCFTCRACIPHVDFPHQHIYSSHMRAVHCSDGLYKCPHCSTFSHTNIKRFNEHIKRHLLWEDADKPRTFSRTGCSLCIPVRVLQKLSCEELSSHADTVHKVDGLLTCPICSSTASDYDSISDHMKSHNAVIPKYFCSFCPIPSPWYNREDYRNHVKENHVDNDGKYNCEICKISSTNYTHVSGHIKEFHDSCNGKDKSRRPIPWLQTAIDNYKKLHNQELRHSLPIGEDNNATTQPDIICVYCPNLKFSSAPGLQDHITFLHPGGQNSANELSFICLGCGYKAEDSHELKSHMDTTHNKYAKFFCPEKGCFCKFKDQIRLDRHLEIRHRNGEEERMKNTKRKFECQICKKNFPTGNTLALHISCQHLTLEQREEFRCPLCQKLCRSKKHFNNHKNKTCPFSNGRKQNTCRICRKTFAAPACLRRHVKSIHCGIREQTIVPVELVAENPFPVSNEEPADLFL